MKKKPVIMVSSTVYGIEELLEKIYAVLTAFGYEVWMSHKGTVPVSPNKTAFENCVAAVEKCDLFLGIITPIYGSGVDKTENISITHKEIRTAIERNKPRWLLSHDHVVFARSLLRKLGFKEQQDRDKLKLENNKELDDLRVINMYEEAILSAQLLAERKGNWVQKYQSDGDALLFATAQFSRFQEVEAFIEENFSKPTAVARRLRKKASL